MFEINLFLHWINSVWDSSVLSLVTGSVNAFCNWPKMGGGKEGNKKDVKKPKQLMLKVFRKVALLIQVRLAAKLQFC